ncbi:uncharacterized protein [Panulirus ornatus]|uniref:uncharacterized protein n=1 Tax=Panulirus ornatus TaxID=150431 RepID=UPI003A89368B
METQMDTECQALPASQVLGDDTLPQDALEDLVFDKFSRRSSLGADSLLDQDFSEDGSYELEGAATLTPLETILGLQYADDIFFVKKAMEGDYHPPNCMADQPQVTEYMRCTIVHWLIKINHRLKFGPETVFLAVNLADRFLAITPLAQDCLQLLAVTTHFLAAKMEECAFPSISELVAICGGNYKHHHFRRMEVLVLSKLEFALYSPTSWYFLDHLALKAAQLGAVDRRVLSLSRSVAETCLGSYEVSQFLPSVQGAASLLVGLTLVSSPTLSHTIQALLFELYTPAEREEVFICSSIMSRYMAPFLETSPSDDAQPYFNSGPASPAAADGHQPPQPPPPSGDSQASSTTTTSSSSSMRGLATL